ncbi:hypothetical protein LPH62_03500 [Xylella taiwanensis]|uniref:hypothetical protein n=1 Tax=Xylella taiwanensis TaxID=1444770 RepID=UPI001269028F|nr:hypothetical protein [Xylella taiwanensis]MCD8461432.1 hypothetical protein [Xylella taiwanensis]UFN25560.1 hypothetical protein LPH62_03500 [Xylella taiwanensis]
MNVRVSTAKQVLPRIPPTTGCADSRRTVLGTHQYHADASSQQMLSKQHRLVLDLHDLHLLELLEGSIQHARFRPSGQCASDPSYTIFNHTQRHTG